MGSATEPLTSLSRIPIRHLHKKSRTTSRKPTHATTAKPTAIDIHTASSFSAGNITEPPRLRQSRWLPRTTGVWAGVLLQQQRQSASLARWQPSVEIVSRLELQQPIVISTVNVAP